MTFSADPTDMAGCPILRVFGEGWDSSRKSSTSHQPHPTLCDETAKDGAPGTGRACVWAAAQDVSGDEMAPVSGHVAGDDRDDCGVDDFGADDFWVDELGLLVPRHSLFVFVGWLRYIDS